MFSFQVLASVPGSYQRVISCPRCAEWAEVRSHWPDWAFSQFRLQVWDNPACSRITKSPGSCSQALQLFQGDGDRIPTSQGDHQPPPCWAHADMSLVLSSICKNEDKQFLTLFVPFPILLSPKIPGLARIAHLLITHLWFIPVTSWLSQLISTTPSFLSSLPHPSFKQHGSHQMAKQ